MTDAALSRLAPSFAFGRPRRIVLRKFTERCVERGRQRSFAVDQVSPLQLDAKSMPLKSQLYTVWRKRDHIVTTLDAECTFDGLL
jgi:hypothetical protein